jgi:hypothetical protein
MTSMGDFVLPGTRDSPTSTGVLIHAVVQAFSSRSNRRRLESHIYALWGEILSRLVGDLHGVIAAPQYKIYTSSEAAGAKVDPNSSGYTVPDANAHETIPDFTLLGIILADRNTQQVVRDVGHDFSFRNWPDLQIAAWRPFLLFELKRMPGRHIEDIDLFTHSLQDFMVEAMEEAEEQAETAFTESACKNPAYSLEKLILIAAAGEWWRFCIMDKNSADLRRNSTNNNILDENSDSDKDIHKKVHTTALKQRSSTSRHRSSKSRTNTGRGKGTGSKDTTPTVHWTELHERAIVAKFEQYYEDAVPPNGEWSAFILYGTQESNQRMFNIHEMLESMSDDLALEATRKGNPREEEPESEDELEREDESASEDEPENESENEDEWENEEPERESESESEDELNTLGPSF